MTNWEDRTDGEAVIPESAQIMDVTGLYISPGFIDSPLYRALPGRWNWYLSWKQKADFAVFDGNINIKMAMVSGKRLYESF